MIAREADGRWTKGMSPNPGGRPKGLAALIREHSGDGQELVAFMFTVFRGEAINGRKPGTAMRMDAATWLSDRAFGKPIQAVVHAGTLSQPWKVLDGMSDEDLEELVQASKALNEARANAIEGEARMLESDVDSADASSQDMRGLGD